MRETPGRLWIALVALIGLWPVGSVEAGQPNDTLPGFRTVNLLEGRGIDNVNVFNGDPSVVIPLGPQYALGAGVSWQLRAFYSAKFWHFDQICPPTDELHHAYVSGYPTLGAGWTLELGYIHDEDPGPGLRPVYRSPDGGRHPFVLISPNVYETNDGSDLRLTASGGSFALDFPDGTVQVFEHPYQRPRRDPASYDFRDLDWNAAETVRWGLSYMTNRFGQTLLQVDYVGTPMTPDAWKVLRVRLTPTETAGRDITYTWGANDVGGIVWDIVTSIDFRSVGGSLLTATFARVNHTGFLRNRYDNSWVDGSPCPQPRSAQVPLLQSITLSGAAVSPLTYSFSYIPPSDPDERFHGTLKMITLPTSGQIAYTYNGVDAFHSCRPDTCPDLETRVPPTGPAVPEELTQRGERFRRFMDNSAFVITRIETDPVTGLSSSVSYRREIQVPTLTFPPFEPDEFRVTRMVVVTAPGGNGTISRATKYLFHIGFEADSFDSGIELVRRYYETTDAGPTGVTVRSHVYCYGEAGAICGYRNSAGEIQLYGGGFARRQSEFIWYGVKPPGGDVCPSGPVQCNVTESSDFNATARKFRTTVNRSTLPFAPFRTTTTNWTPEVAPWLLNLYSSQAESESGVTVDRRFDFNPANGFLRGTLIYDNPDPTPNDRVWINCRYDQSPARGLAQQEFTATVEWNIGPAAIPTYFCADLAPAMPTNVIGINNDAFGKQHSYQHGLLRSSVWLRSAAGQNFPFSGLTLNLTRDSQTDWVTASFDPSGVGTGYGYDQLGRITSISPQEEDATQVTYDTPTRTTVQRGFGSAGTFERYLYDGFGRLLREIRQMPSGFSVRIRSYDTAGNAFFVSEWASCGDPETDCATRTAPGTTSSNFDPFGRPQAIGKPDGTTASVSYQDGSIQFSDSLKSVTVNNLCIGGGGCPGGTSATTSYRYDIFGRLVQVIEHDGAVTTHGYDVSGNLISVSQAPQPARVFSYDSWGFLRSESTPEKGSVSYQDAALLGNYGSLGNLRRKTEGGVTPSYTYDAAGRVCRELQGVIPITGTCEAPGGGILYTSYSYDAGFRGVGKLTQRIAENPGKPSTVTENFSYLAIGGRLNQKNTSISGTPQGTVFAAQGWNYNSLGLLSTHTHSFIGSDTPISSVLGYAYGLPVSLSASGQTLVSSASYNPSGGIASWTAGNSVATTIVQDSSLLPRPSQIFTSGASINFDTGPYTYDGAGNVRSMGFDPFDYDAQSRLIFSVVAGQARSYSYDRWGNRDPAGVDSNTNRLRAGTYDSRGNLVALGEQNFSYDALSRQTGAGSERYLYDGGSERVARVNAAGRFFTLTPCRVRDTRDPPGIPLSPGVPILAQVTGACGVPAGAVAVSGNLTAAEPGASGFLRLTPGDTDTQTSTLNYNAGVTRANNFVMTLSASGQVRLVSSSTQHAIIDVTGYFLTPSGLETWRLTFRDEGNRLSSTYDVTAGGSFRTKDYFYFGNLLIATNDGANLFFYASDHLGTPRLETNQFATTVAQFAYHPFGEQIIGPFGNQPLKFAAMERDQLSGNDYDHARYCSPLQGRFLSPDLLQGIGEEPQSWNRYSYVINNPLKFVDPEGLWPIWFRFGGQPPSIDLNTPRFSDSITVRGNPFALVAEPGGLTIGTVAFFAGDFARQLGAAGGGLDFARTLAHISPSDLFSPRLTGHGLAAFADGVIPFADPLEEAGVYDPQTSGLEYSQKVGEYTRNLELALGAGYSRALFGRRPAGLFNRGSLLRVGASYNRRTGYTHFSIRGRLIDRIFGQAKKHIDLIKIRRGY